MSDPYGTNPHGQSEQNPYGGGGGAGAYGAPHGGGYQNEPPKTDGVSIAALVTSLLCCLAPIGVILGIVGLSRTKGGQRKGRGLAIAGIIVGILMSIGVGIAGAALFIFADSLVTLDDVKVGQCVNVDQDDDTVVMYKKECSEEHDAEIVGVEEVDSENQDAITDGMADYCRQVVSEEDQAAIAESGKDLEYKALIEEPNNVEVGHHLVCYVESSDKLTEPIL